MKHVQHMQPGTDMVKKTFHLLAQINVTDLTLINTQNDLYLNSGDYVMVSMVLLTSKLTLVCGNMCVFLYFCRVTRSELTCDTRVNFHVEYASSISCSTRDPSSCAALL